MVERPSAMDYSQVHAFYCDAVAVLDLVFGDAGGRWRSGAFQHRSGLTVMKCCCRRRSKGNVGWRRGLLSALDLIAEVVAHSVAVDLAGGGVLRINGEKLLDVYADLRFARLGLGYKSPPDPGP